MISVNKVIVIVLTALYMSAGVVVAAEYEDFPPCSLEISCPCAPDEMKSILQVGDKVLFMLPGTNTVSNSIQIQ